MTSPTSPTTITSLAGLTAADQRLTFGDFEKTVLNFYAHQINIDPAPGTTKGCTCLLLSDDEWALRPENILADGAIRPRPNGVAPPALTANATAATIANWNDAKARAREFAAAESAAIIAFLTAIGPALTAAIGSPDTGTMNMTLQEMFAALKAHIGTPATADVNATYATLQAPIHTAFETHLTAQVEIHARLAAAGQPLSEHLKLEYYAAATAAHTGITTARRAYLVKKPRLADQRFADLVTYLNEQVANITAAVSLGHAGYQPAIASLATAAGTASAAQAVESAALTRAEVNALRAFIRLQTAPTVPTPPRAPRGGDDRSGRRGPYCDIHGQRGHSGLECFLMTADPDKHAAARTITSAEQVTPAVAALRAAAPRRVPRPVA